MTVTLLIILPISFLIFGTLYVSLMRGFQSFAIKCYSVIELFKGRRKSDFNFTSAKVTTIERQVIVAVWLSTKLNQAIWIISLSLLSFYFLKPPQLSERMCSQSTAHGYLGELYISFLQIMPGGSLTVQHERRCTFGRGPRYKHTSVHMFPSITVRLVLQRE